jgi:hypothetical protein
MQTHRDQHETAAGGQWIRLWPGSPALFGLLLAGAVLSFGTGCRLVKSTAELPAKAVSTVTPSQKDKQAVSPVEMQQTLLRFADGFSSQMIDAVDDLAHGTNRLTTAEALRIKLAFTTECTSIVTGPNAIANLIDMTAFVTVTRMSIEQYWQPKVYGDSAQSMLEYCRFAEVEIWRVASTALTQPQLVQMREAIETWHRNQPSPACMLGTRTIELATEIKRANKEAANAPGNVLGLLMLDPLSGMDPAVREIAQTRLFAERAIYLMQKLPNTLRWQTELMSLNTVDIPTVQQVVTNSTQIAAALDRFAVTAEKLPAQVSTEREAIVKALESQEKDVASLFNAGTAMSDSLNTTFQTFDALMQRFGVGETNNSTAQSTNAQPFRIQDYTATAAQLESTAKQLTELMLTLDRTLGSTNLAALSAQLSPAVADARAGGRAVVDYAFWKGLLLIGIALVAALVYRFLSARWIATARK